MKTLADLKREAASGKIRFEMVERYGKTGDAILKYHIHFIKCYTED